MSWFSRDPKSRFWAWFQRNDDRLFRFETDQDQIFNELIIELRRVHPDLTFEFGPEINGSREFVVSAGGIRKAFHAVEDLCSVAPVLPRWRFLAFRPRRDLPETLSLNGLTIAIDDVRFATEEDGDRLGITLTIPGFHSTDDQTYEQIGFLLLDVALGEYTVETRIGFIEFADAALSRAASYRQLRDLPRAVDDWRKIT